MKNVTRSMLIVAAAAAGVSSSALADFNYVDFSSTESLNLVGVATQSSNRLLVTPSVRSSAGAVWHGVQQRVSGGFDTTMVIKIEDKLGGGADGMAFVIQNSAPTPIGAGGGGIGYGENPVFGTPGIANSLAVEFDMWNNSPQDWNDAGSSHVSIQSRGTLQNNPDAAHSLGAAGTNDLSDGSSHTLRVRYIGGVMSVFIDGNLALQASVNLAGLLALNPDSVDGVGQAWVGITAATGGNLDRQAHVLESWRFEGTPPIPTPAAAGLLVPALLMGARRRR